MKFIYFCIALFLGFAANAAQIELITNSQIQAQSRYSYNFGSVSVNSRVIQQFNIRNTGTTPLTYKDAYIYGRDFSAGHQCVKGLMPNEICSVRISYWPLFEGTSSGRFALNFLEDSIVIDLWGQARRR